MKSKTMLLLIATVFLLGAIGLIMLPSKVAGAPTITYTTTTANSADTPIWGTMIGPSSYYNGDDRNGSSQTGSAAMPYGNALDQSRVFILDNGYLSDNPFEMLKWDMGGATNFVRIYNDIEHNGSNPWDYLQWSVWGSNSTAESSSAWTLLWDPSATTGSTNNDFTVTAVNGAATSAKIYRQGDPAVGTISGTAYSDAFTIDLNLTSNYRYFGIRASTLAHNNGSSDPEMNAVATTSTTPITPIQPNPPVTPAPVGGYSFSIEGYSSAKPLTPYLAFIGILTIGFIAIRRKTLKKTT